MKPILSIIFAMLVIRNTDKMFKYAERRDICKTICYATTAILAAIMLVYLN